MLVTAQYEITMQDFQDALNKLPDARKEVLNAAKLVAYQMKLGEHTVTFHLDIESVTWKPNCNLLIKSI